MDVKPNHTVYINNLNEKIKKEELKKSLYAIFSQFGQILDIVALKTLKMRGQAFVIFSDVNSASSAIRSMQGFPFYEKPMRLNYAKEQSDVIAKRAGTFVERPAKKKNALTSVENNNKSSTTTTTTTSSDAKKKDHHSTSSASDAPAPAAPVADETGTSSAMETTASESAPSAEPPTTVSGVDLPNKILFLINLPDDTEQQTLQMLFQPFTGFKEVRLVPGRADIAFVEFESEQQSTMAKEALQGFKISPSNAIKISFAKK